MGLCKLIMLLPVCFAQATRFDLTESEINQHIAYSLKTAPRPGLDSMMLKFFDENYVSTYTTVDFDAVERWKPGTIPAMLRPVLSGKRAIWIDIRFFVKNAHATYKIEKAYYDKIPIPAFVLDKAIQVIAARQPEKYDTTKPVPLPFGMRTMWTKPRRIIGEK